MAAVSGSRDSWQPSAGGKAKFRCRGHVFEVTCAVKLRTCDDYLERMTEFNSESGKRRPESATAPQRAVRARVNRCQGAHRTRPAIFRCAIRDELTVTENKVGGESEGDQ
jgi:hypothetical protein